MSFVDEQSEVSDDSSGESKRRRRRRRWSSGACHAQLQPWLESEEESDDSNGQTLQTSRRRRGWKRFIAALPLMPLATAYVVVRLGWDVFELLVFCTIDALLNAAAHSVSTVHTAVTTMRTLVTGLVTRLNLKQRMIDAAILITETTVVWAFNTGLPAIGSFISYLLARCTDFGCWWQETGGPVLRDFTELAVLDYIVPACSATAAGISATYWRVCWLARQIWKAARILGWDLMCDLALLWQWIGAVSGWLKHHRHWLRPALLMLLPSSERIRMVKAFVSGVMAPWICAKAVLAYERAWRPAFRACVLAGDCAIHTIAAGLWPIAIQGWRDSIQVLVEMCRQLAAAVDLAVATIGDLIVDFARRSTVHSNSLSGRTSSVYGSDGLPEKKML
ncbi:hypothetical protein EC988_000116 [Linderina pennispora]|nr:hypothetical protein EC988_000116 [Linderina pennispora]